MSACYNENIKIETDRVMRGKIIKLADSPLGFLVVIAGNKNCSPRFCKEYRALIKKMNTKELLISKIEDILDEFQESIVFSEIDMFYEYWQVKIADHVQENTEFKCRYGSFQCQLRPFGLMNARIMFKRMVNELFKDQKFVGDHIDDVNIRFQNVQEHLKHLSLLFDRILNRNLNVKQIGLSLQVQSLRFLATLFRKRE